MTCFAIPATWVDRPTGRLVCAWRVNAVLTGTAASPLGGCSRLSVWEAAAVAGLEVRAVVSSREWTLGAEPRTVPATPIVLAVSGSRSRTVHLDGRLMRLSAGREGLLAIDLTRSTGYHRLLVDGSVFWFGTEDAKLGLQGIEAMLAHLRTAGTGWTGQALFSDGSGLRDPHVLYAWLDQWADRALEGVAALLASPRAVTSNTQALSRRGGPAVLLSPTLRLLRSAPRLYLSPNPTGLIKAGGTAYDPLRVVVRRRTTTLDTVANRRAVAVLNWLIKLCTEVIASLPDSGTTVRCRLWLNLARMLKRRPLAQTLASAATLSAAPRQAEEATEIAYRTTYDTARDLRRLFGWTASLTPLPRFSYVERADTIYQAYTASCMAQALGLTQTSHVLGSTPLAFTGPRFDLYYDTPPPAHVLRSWRASSSRPDTSRPDLLLHERASGRIALLDAKYRVGQDGHASEDSRKEVTAYLGLYGLHGITILYPGVGAETSTVTGHGRSIVEVQATPPADLSTAVGAVLSTLQRPPF